jgi:PAS domain S-box-containing protein
LIDFSDERCSCLLLDSIHLGLVFLKEDWHIIYINRSASDKLLINQKEVINRHWNEVFPTLSIDEIDAKETLHISMSDETFVIQKQPFYQNGKFHGFVLIFQNTFVLEEISKELDSYKNLNFDLKAIFDISYDVIYVSDGNGITLRVSSSCETLWGLKEAEFFGKSVYQLEAEGVFKPSVTRLVLEKKEKVSLIQTTKTGKRLMVVGIPIKDDKGNIIRVVNASRDITEISELQTELEFMKQLIEGYRQELKDFRTRDELERKIISLNEKMKKVSILAQKIAVVDTNVLLIGETGVGKDVFANFIHNWSDRKKSPFITVSCGALLEALLDQEFFGNGEGKLGAFELANDGTLFLDEIHEIPLPLQVKLIRVIQERKITRNKDSSQLQLNVRLITSTNGNLEELIRLGKFRRELYYLLNVVPIHIPPLRERKEDIVPLILYFIKQLNSKYDMNKTFNPSLLKILQEYHWPGNVRELQNIVERLLVTHEDVMIGIEHLPEHMRLGVNEQKTIQINKIIPLKEAMELVEKELLEMAQKKHVSTTKIAELLGVNQSTVSRKLNRYKKNS